MTEKLLVVSPPSKEPSQQPSQARHTRRARARTWFGSQIIALVQGGSARCFQYRTLPAPRRGAAAGKRAIDQRTQSTPQVAADGRPSRERVLTGAVGSTTTAKPSKDAP
jgi:hypothetical protein